MTPANPQPAPTPRSATAPIRILGRANSFNVRKVLWLCDEIGLPYIREDFGRGFQPTSTPEFLRLNPTGQVPVVIDGDTVLRESNAIIRYLASRHRADTLFPADPAGRARIEQWMDWVAYDVTHALRGAFLGGQLREPPWNNPWFIAQGKADLTGLMDLLDGHLRETGPYVVGGAFTLADIPIGLVVNRWFMIDGLDRPPFPGLAAYYDLLGERPAYRKHGRNGLP
jgi:glutathione S-transferase